MSFERWALANPRNEAARASIAAENPDVDIRTVILDLNSQASVRKAAKEIESFGNVDVLINNAAVMMCPYSTTEDGLETQFGSNYVGPWLLTNLLLPSILKTPSPRIVIVASSGHAWGDIRWDDPGFTNGEKYDKLAAYGQSKTGNILFAISLAEKYGKDGLVAISVHVSHTHLPLSDHQPGAIATNLMRHLTDEDREMWSYSLNPDGTPKPELNLFKTVAQGASTTLTAAFDPRMEKVNGQYLVDCQVGKDFEPDLDFVEDLDRIRPHAKDHKSAERLWEMTNRIVGEKF